MKNLMLCGLIIFGIYAYSDYREDIVKEKQKAREVDCQANPVCRDKQANQGAKFKSMIGEELVRSSTGVVYYRGNPCSIDCSGHIAGYQWAEERGISKDMGCTGYSQSFIQGCLTYVQERTADLKVEDEIEESDDRESCTSGRYGDC